MTTKQEIKNLTRERVPNIVDERILPEMLDEVADWSGELAGKLTTLSAESEKEASGAWETFYAALVKEVIKQLKQPAKSKVVKKTKD